MMRESILVLLTKHGRGENVGLCNVEDRKALDVIYFLHWFGEKHTSIWSMILRAQMVEEE
jgi:hypothetical protein